MPRPKKKPTKTISIRVQKDFLDFFATLENRNDYFLNLIQNDPNYQKFLQDKKAKENENQPSLFNNLY